MPISSDLDLRDALGALTAGQPAQPADRLSAVTSRARHLRRTRYGTVALALASVVAVVAALVAVPTLTHPTPPAGTPTPLSAWPDRSLPDDQSVANGALEAWYKQQYGIVSIAENPHWLFRGDVPSPDGNTNYLAVFLSPGTGSAQQLVLARTHRSQVDANGIDINAQPGTSPWVIRHSDASHETTAVFVGTYLGNLTTPYSNTLFVLADPAARELRFTMSPLPFASVDVGSGMTDEPVGSLSSRTGLFIADVGVLTGPLDVVLTDSRQHPFGAGPLSVDDGPLLAAPAEPDTPANFHSHWSATGQSQRTPSGGFVDDMVLDSTPPPTDTWAIYVRCYGAGLLTVVFDTVHGGVHTTAKAAVVCDGVTHEPFAPANRPGITELSLRLSHTSMQAYTYVLGTLG